MDPCSEWAWDLVHYSGALLRRTMRVEVHAVENRAWSPGCSMTALWPYQATSSDVVSRSTIRRVTSRAPASLRWQSS